MRPRKYFTYLLTNADRNVFYTGMTNNLVRRLVEHWVGKEGSFTTRYRVHFLLWHEETRYVNNAIAREKEIKRMLRAQKIDLITAANPEWVFQNKDFLNHWPPLPEQIEEVQQFWQTDDLDALFRNNQNETPDADALQSA